MLALSLRQMGGNHRTDELRHGERECSEGLELTWRREGVDNDDQSTAG
jgi:hypothetical protein